MRVPSPHPPKVLQKPDPYPEQHQTTTSIQKETNMILIDFYRIDPNGRGGVATFLESLPFPCRLHKGDMVELKAIHYQVLDCVFRLHSDGSITQSVHVAKI